MLGPLRKRLPALWLALGCILPDLIDKPLFYALIFVHGSAPSPLRGSRTVGHTLLFFLVILLVAFLRKRPSTWAVVTGVGTHLALDVVGEAFASGNPESAVWLALFWPLCGWDFPLATYTTMLQHLRVGLLQVYVVAGEVVGGAILLHSWWRRRQLS